MKFLSGLIVLISAISFSEIFALPPPELTPSPAPTPKMIALPIPKDAPTLAPENSANSPPFHVPPTEVLQIIRPTGECVVSVRLEENAPRGHVIFHCEGLMTTLPLSRRSLASVQANENAHAEGTR